jgi:hypothetical protein
MTTTMTSAQFAWRQFSTNHFNRERDEYLAEERTAADNHEELFDVPTTPTHGPSTSKTTHKSKQHAATLKLSSGGVQKAVITAIIETIQQPTTCHEVVNKAKTRAARRKIEPEQIETPAEVLPAKRERRSDYWVHRADERRSAARTFKTQAQAQDQAQDQD